MARSPGPKRTRQHMDDEEGRAERRGCRLELRGGPLAGRSARVHDTEVRLAVIQENGRLRMSPTTTPEPPSRTDGGKVIGAYGFSHREEALVWFPAL